jgi:hypothetical protein
MCSSPKFKIKSGKVTFFLVLMMWWTQTICKISTTGRGQNTDLFPHFNDLLVYCSIIWNYFEVSMKSTSSDSLHCFCLKSQLLALIFGWHHIIFFQHLCDCSNRQKMKKGSQGYSNLMESGHRIFPSYNNLHRSWCEIFLMHQWKDLVLKAWIIFASGLSLWPWRLADATYIFTNISKI